MRVACNRYRGAWTYKRPETLARSRRSNRDRFNNLVVCCGVVCETAGRAVPPWNGTSPKRRSRSRLAGRQGRMAQRPCYPTRRLKSRDQPRWAIRRAICQCCSRRAAHSIWESMSHLLQKSDTSRPETSMRSRGNFFVPSLRTRALLCGIGRGASQI